MQDVLFELIKALDANEISYAVMGGLAVRVYALPPPPTQDVDIAVALGPEAISGASRNRGKGWVRRP